MTLSHVWIRHYGILDGYHPPLVTCEWLEQKTELRHFDYFYDNE